MARLVCNEPGVLETVEHYVITGLPGSPITVNPDPDPAVGFSYNLTGLAPGAYTVKANACNLWGCSIDSVPFVFTALAAPSQPVGLRILFG
jgi:hypothetical protein